MNEPQERVLGIRITAHSGSVSRCESSAIANYFLRKFALNEYLHEIVNSLLELLEEFISVLTKTSLVIKLKATTKHKASFVTIIVFVRRGRSAQQTRLQLSYKTDQLVHCWSAVGSSGTVTCRSHCKCCVFS